MSEKNRKTGQKLTPKQRLALEALIEGGKNKDAALVAGVTDRTLHRWQKQDDFAAELQRRTAQRDKDFDRRLAAEQDEMLDKVLMTARNERGMYSESVCLRAALAVINLRMKVREVELEERVRVLEERLGV